MNCKTLKHNYSAHMDGQLSQKEFEAVSDHLRDCPTCQAWADEMEGTWQLLGSVPGAAASPFFQTRVRAKVATEKPDRETSLGVRILIPVSATALLVLGVLFGSLLGMNGNGYTAPQTQTDWMDGLHLDSFDAIPSTSIGAAYFETAGNDLSEDGGAP